MPEFNNIFSIYLVGLKAWIIAHKGNFIFCPVVFNQSFIHYAFVFAYYYISKIIFYIIQSIQFFRLQ